MEKKDLDKHFKSKKVKVAEDSVVVKHEKLIAEILGFFNQAKSPFSFHSDKSCLAHVIGIVDSGIIKIKQEKYLLDRINEFLEKKLGTKDLYKPLGKILPKIKIKPHKFKDHPFSPFLGILYLKDSEGENWKLDYFLAQKSQVDYLDGHMFGKISPFNGDSKIVEGILEDHRNMKKRVYGREDNVFYKAATVEGDHLMFKNISEVCNWLTARASNYVPGNSQSW